MMSFDVSVALRRLNNAKSVNKRQADEAFTAFAARVVQAARELAPVRTGFLRDNIEYEKVPNGVIIRSGAEYSAFIEWGTVKMAARPYFFRSVDENLPGLLRDLKATKL